MKQDEYAFIPVGKSGKSFMMTLKELEDVVGKQMVGEIEIIDKKMVDVVVRNKYQKPVARLPVKDAITKFG